MRIFFLFQKVYKEFLFQVNQLWNSVTEKTLMLFMLDLLNKKKNMTKS